MTAARLVGSNAPGILEASAWLRELAEAPDVLEVDVASAYWGANVVGDAQQLVPTTGLVRLLLWDLGGTKDRLLPVLDAAAGDERIDLRFIGSTRDGGTFHPKVIGVVGPDGAWVRALVGSANFTRNAMTRNVEVAVEVLDPDLLAELQAWFEGEWTAALSAADVDVDEALRVLPDTPPRRGPGFAPPSGGRSAPR
jgi:hypothetical protein